MADVLHRNVSGGTEENYDNSQPEYERQFIHLSLPDSIQQILAQSQV